MHRARIVHQHVQTPESRDAFSDGSLGIFRLCYVARNRERLSTLFLDFAYHFPKLFGPSACDCHVGSLT
jgi:hypothetical protein